MNRDNSINISNSTYTGDILQGNTVEGGIKNTQTSESNRELLKICSELKTILRSDAVLQESSKTEILGELEVLETAAHSSSDQKNLSLAQRSLKVLKGIVTDLPIESHFHKSFNHSFPAIKNKVGF